MKKKRPNITDKSARKKRKEYTRRKRENESEEERKKRLQKNVAYVRARRAKLKEEKLKATEGQLQCNILKMNRRRTNITDRSTRIKWKEYTRRKRENESEEERKKRLKKNVVYARARRAKLKEEKLRATEGQLQKIKITKRRKNRCTITASTKKEILKEIKHIRKEKEKMLLRRRARYAKLKKEKLRAAQDQLEWMLNVENVAPQPAKYVCILPGKENNSSIRIASKSSDFHHTNNYLHVQKSFKTYGSSTKQCKSRQPKTPVNLHFLSNFQSLSASHANLIAAKKAEFSRIVSSSQSFQPVLQPQIIISGTSSAPKCSELSFQHTSSTLSTQNSLCFVTESNASVNCVQACFNSNASVIQKNPHITEVVHKALGIHMESSVDRLSQPPITVSHSEPKTDSQLLVAEPVKIMEESLGEEEIIRLTKSKTGEHMPTITNVALADLGGKISNNKTNAVFQVRVGEGDGMSHVDNVAPQPAKDAYILPDKESASESCAKLKSQTSSVLTSFKTYESSIKQCASVQPKTHVNLHSVSNFQSQLSSHANPMVVKKANFSNTAKNISSDQILLLVPVLQHQTIIPGTSSAPSSSELSFQHTSSTLSTQNSLYSVTKPNASVNIVQTCFNSNASVTQTKIHTTDGVHTAGGQISMESSVDKLSQLPIPVSYSETKTNSQLLIAEPVKIKEEPLDEEEMSGLTMSKTQEHMPTITNAAVMDLAGKISSNKTIAVSQIKVEEDDGAHGLHEVTHVDIIQCNNNHDYVLEAPTGHSDDTNSNPEFYPNQQSLNLMQNTELQPAYHRKNYNRDTTSVFASIPTRESSLSHSGPVQNSLPPGYVQRQQSCDVKPPVIQAAVLAGNEPIQLWQFLLEVLADESCQYFIRWTGNGWEFKITDPHEVARRWGICENNPKMNYTNLKSRLRIYNNKNIIHKVAFRHHLYRFECDLQNLLGYTPEELHAMAGLKSMKEK